MPSKRKSGHYPGPFVTIPLPQSNASRELFRHKLEAIPFLGYEVEQLADGRKVCITKPGGKNVFGQMKIHDFMVWVYDPCTQDRWRISHQEIWEDVEAKISADREAGLQVLQALERVHDGDDPEQVLWDFQDLLKHKLPGEPIDLLLKVYKWIWGQEDCNYPTKEGRSLSMKELRKLGTV